MKSLLCCTFFALSLLLAVPVAAKDGAAAAAKRGDWGTVVRIWKSKAEQGDAVSQYNLGQLYREGRPGVSQNFPAAVKWYRKAAENEVPAAKNAHSYAMYALGVMYAQGEGVSQSDVFAYMWCSLAAVLTNNQPDYAAENCRDIAASRMTSADISLAQRLAKACLVRNDGEKCAR
jgi:hypothetical protein